MSWTRQTPMIKPQKQGTHQPSKVAHSLGFTGQEMTQVMIVMLKSTSPFVAIGNPTRKAF